MVFGVLFRERLLYFYGSLLPKLCIGVWVDMGYYTTLTIYNVNTKYNNNALYKILINKKIIKIIYGTTSIPFYMIQHNLIIQSQYSIQCTVYTDNWVQCSFGQYIAWVRMKIVSYDKQHMCANGSALCLSPLMDWDTCYTQICIITFRDTCINRKYIANACNNTLLH